MSPAKPGSVARQPNRRNSSVTSTGHRTCRCPWRKGQAKEMCLQMFLECKQLKWLNGQTAYVWPWGLHIIVFLGRVSCYVCVFYWPVNQMVQPRKPPRWPRTCPLLWRDTWCCWGVTFVDLVWNTQIAISSYGLNSVKYNTTTHLLNSLIGTSPCSKHYALLEAYFV